MRTLEFNVDKQRITKTGNFEDIVSGSKGYLRASFVFGEDWDNYRKVAAFYDVNGDEYAVVLKDNSCDVPDEVTDGRKFSVRMFGRNERRRINTNSVIVRQEVL